MSKNSNDKKPKNGRQSKSTKPTYRSGGKKTTKSVRNCSVEPDFRGTNSEKFEDIHSNNIEWWNKSPIYNDATQIAQNRFPGYFYDDRAALNPSGYNTSPAATSWKATTPGIMMLEYVPTIGYSDSEDSPINKSFTSLYAQIAAHTNSGNLGFTQASLAMITIAAYSVAMTIGHAKRILGLRRVWDNSNGNLPVGILKALDVAANLSTIQWEDYRVQLNTHIDSFNALQIPRYVSIFDRAFQLGYNIYADEDSTEAQFYGFKSTGFYVYRDTENKAEFITWYEFLANYQKQYPGLKLADPLGMYISALDYQISQLRRTSDIALIMGAFRRAFPSSAAMRFEYADANDVVVPFYDKVMMWQINNADIIPGTPENLDVTENVAQDFIISQPQIIGINSGGPENRFNTNAFHVGNRIINSYEGDWTPEFLMEATRLKVILDEITEFDAPTTAYVKTSGTEIVVGCTIWNMSADGGAQYDYYPGDLFYVVSKDHPDIGSTIAGFYADMRALSNTAKYPLIRNITEAVQKASKFRNRPLIYCYQSTPFSTAAPINQAYVNEALQRMYFMNVQGDLYKWSVITKSQLGQLHLAALQSAYLVNVPTNWE